MSDAQRSGLAGDRAQRGLHGVEDGGATAGGAKERPRKIVNYLADALEGDWVDLIAEDGWPTRVSVRAFVQVGSAAPGCLVRPVDTTRPSGMGEILCIDNATRQRACLRRGPTDDE